MILVVLSSTLNYPMPRMFGNIRPSVARVRWLTPIEDAGARRVSCSRKSVEYCREAANCSSETSDTATLLFAEAFSKPPSTSWL